MAKKSNTENISSSISSEVAALFDKVIALRGYKSRSDALEEAMLQFCGQQIMLLEAMRIMVSSSLDEHLHYLDGLRRGLKK